MHFHPFDPPLICVERTYHELAAVGRIPVSVPNVAVAEHAFRDATGHQRQVSVLVSEPETTLKHDICHIVFGELPNGH